MKKIKILMAACITAFALMVLSGCGTTIVLNRYLNMNDATLAYMLTSDGVFTMYNATTQTEDWTDYEFNAAQNLVGGRPWEDRIGDIKKVVIMENVGSVGSYSFYGASNLTELQIGPDVTHINENAFKNCFNLKTITIDPANTSFSTENGYLVQLSDNKIIRGTSATDIVLDSSVSVIEDSAFGGLTTIKSIDMSQSSITEIAPNTFEDCTSLTTVKLPAGLQSIGSNAFKGCTALSEVDFEDCDSLTTIGDIAFFGCTALGEINLPASLSNIGVLAFSKTAAKSVSFAESDVSVVIGSNAFYECDALKEVYIANPTITSRCTNSSTVGYLLANTYAASHGEVVRNLTIYIAASCYDADSMGAYLANTENYVKEAENQTIDGVEYVVYTAV